MNAARAYWILEEVRKLQAEAGYKARTTQPIAKQMLLNGDFFYNGNYLTPLVKSVGCGVYDVWVEIKG